MNCKKILFLGLVVVGALFTGCGKKHSSDDDVNFEPPTVSFDISGGEALGGQEVDSSRSARDATDLSSVSLVKIMSDGSLKSAISCQVPELDIPDAEKTRMTKYGKLTDVFLPPKGSNCSDVYLLFDGPTYFPAVNEEEPGTVGYWGLSRLLCIHADGTWTDILNDSPWGVTHYPIDSKKNIQIAEDGSLFVLFRDGGGWEYYIRKYDPETKTVSEVCRFGQSAPLDEETVGWTAEQWESNTINITRMEISKDGKWAYIQIVKPGRKQYLHVAEIANPANFKDIVLDENIGGIESFCCWDYDEKSNKLYYLKIDRSNPNDVKGVVKKADYNGSNEVSFKNEDNNDVTLSGSYDALIVVAQNTVWVKETTAVYHVKLTDIYSGATNEIDSLTSMSTPYYCGNNYIVKDNAVYFCYGNESDYGKYPGCFKYNEILRVAITNDLSTARVINYKTANSNLGNNLLITSWSVGDSKLYVTGVSGLGVNYEINLDGSKKKLIGFEGQVFTSIGSLK